MEAQAPVAVVLVPFTAQGHLNQLLHFSRLLSAWGLPVHFVSSATHNRQAKLRVEGWNPETISNIHFHDLPLPPFPTPPPDPHALNKFPDHLLPAFEATAHLRHPFAALLHTLSSTARRIVVVHESQMNFARQEASNYPNAESYQFHCPSAIFRSFLQEFKAMGKLTDQVTNSSGLPKLLLDGYFTQRFYDFLSSRREMVMAPAAGHLFNTCRLIEGQFLDLLARDTYLGSKIWAIGPLNPIDAARSSCCHWCLEWLDKQPPKSVIYVSFGTMSSISDEQICEIAVGLERSKHKFVWVVREADKGDIFAQGEKEEVRRIQLPEGYEERVGEVGRVVRDWAPQLEILGHPSVGGFMSHCGWNSCMESMSMGVPIAAWPMHTDQPKNAMLVTGVLRIGVMVREWSRREDMVTAEVVEDAVRRLMVSEEGNEMMKRAEELGKKVREGWSEGGSCRAEFESFVSHISRE